MPSKKLTTSAYKKLLAGICAVYDAGMKEAAASLESIMKNVRGEIGRVLVKAGLDGTYGEHHLEKVSRDLTASQRRGFSVRSLRNMRQVCQAFTKRQISAELLWSHLVLLSSVEDKKTREEYFKKAVSYKLDLPALQKELEEKKLLSAPASILLEAPDKTEKNLSESPRLKVKRGTLRTYRIKETLNSLEPSTLQIDCGFYNYHDLDAKQVQKLKLKAGDCVSAGTKSGGWKLTRLETKVKQITFLYTFQASLHRLPDADTPTVVAVQGFGFVTRQKLRMRNLNAPEINTDAGKKAREFVFEKLSSVKFFIVKTYSTDIYDRYLVDIFYLPGEADPQKVADEGIYLNQELIDNGHAEVWRKIGPEDLMELN